MLRSKRGLHFGSTCSKCRSSKGEIMAISSGCFIGHRATPVVTEAFLPFRYCSLCLGSKVDTEFGQGLLTWRGARPNRHRPSATPLSDNPLTTLARAAKCNSLRAEFRHDLLRWPCQLHSENGASLRAHMRAAQRRFLGLVPAADRETLCCQRLDPQMDLRRRNQQTSGTESDRAQPELLKTSMQWCALCVLGLHP